MCIRDRAFAIGIQDARLAAHNELVLFCAADPMQVVGDLLRDLGTVSYTHLRAHETVLDLVCRLLLEKKKKNKQEKINKKKKNTQHH